MGETNTHENGCPLAAVDRRLEDVHRQWHEAEKAYFDPEQFRVSIQACIQTLRTVTFILQSNKRLLPDFEAWYQEWRDRLGADSLMRWMVDARNRIEKQGDLEAHSYIRAEIVASYLNEGPIVEVPAKLFDGPSALIKGIPETSLGEHIRKNGTLRIQRRWIENTLPNFELLDAVAIAYGRIAELVYDAHHQLKLDGPVTMDPETGQIYPVGRGGRLPCMIGHSDERTINLSLATGASMTLTRKAVFIDTKIDDKLETRYGIKPEEIFDLTDDEERVLQSTFKTARILTEKDGYHITIIILLKGGKPVTMMRIEPENHGEKYLLMRNLAREVTKFDADAVIMIGEIWKASIDPKATPYMRAADAPDRQEWLSGMLVRKSGKSVHLGARFIRDGERVVLDDTKVLQSGTLFIFAPVYEAWGRPVTGTGQES
jgi:hypothetical protein